MNVELFVLCDAATDDHGKLNILGAFDGIWSKEVPALQQSCAIAIRVRFEKTEEGEHKIRINIVDEDGKPILQPVEAGVNVRVQGMPYSSVAMNLILNLQRIKFPNYGEYSIDMVIDGKHEAELPLYVNKVS